MFFLDCFVFLASYRWLSVEQTIVEMLTIKIIYMYNVNEKNDEKPTNQPVEGANCELNERRRT